MPDVKGERFLCETFPNWWNALAGLDHPADFAAAVRAKAVQDDATRRMEFAGCIANAPTRRATAAIDMGKNAFLAIIGDFRPPLQGGRRESGSDVHV